jgi:uncharacterized protein YjbI with pentapeptide repeats/energy-coupling factor transporter ATP-binding protein EcfA2
MVVAKRAAVRPRVFTAQNSDPLPLEDEILSLVEARARGCIAILGSTGSGKTSALKHLGALLPADCRVLLLDEPNLSQLLEAGLQLLDSPVTAESLVIYAAQSLRPVHHELVYRLAPWCSDDGIEYLLAEHRPRCASLMARVRPEDELLLGGVAELWKVALDRLASDATLPDVRRALHHILQEHLTDTDLLERARSACLNVVVNPELALAEKLTGLARPGFANHLLRLLSYPPMQLLLATERIASDLNGESDCDYLARRLPRELVEATGRLLIADSKALLQLQTLLSGPPWSHAMAVSLLHAAGRSAELQDHCPTQLAGAYLPGVSWPGIRLEGADLTDVDLTVADLTGAVLIGAVLRRSVLCQACLRAANLNEIVATEADLSAANLTRICAHRAQFDSARLDRADLSRSVLSKSSFVGASLRHTSFRGCNLEEALFTDAEWEETDFTGGNLTCADLSGRCLRKAHWFGATFRRALLDNCDLEYMQMREADFQGASLQGALLTGSAMQGADLRGANLQNSGLADIEWEGADLRGADLRGASFHMGSTRSGLVGSTIPCEGSRTGFYTDDFEEQTFKAPEEIRKANLCGADLSGAILDGVDFYLVDLRGAVYDENYKDHLQRCGAILETRT